MNMKLLLLLVGSLLSAAAAESMRETELMDPIVKIEDLSEGSGPDDEDLFTDYYDEEDSDSLDQSSGSGDDEIEDDLELTDDTPKTSIDNNSVEEDDDLDVNENEIVQKDNDIEILRKTIPDDPSNEISMASTSQGFFSRTEVVIAVVAGGLVGLVFAVIIVLLVMRVRRNNKDITYDAVKKPIYKKAPTIEA
ncbi:syndecan-4-like [Leptodactylus fuscus]|uniref:syndecan-4-like n=1 Tax=Leptodactylus fuscus TaxID=238119 RepID=UPI003F4F1B9F